MYELIIAEQREAFRRNADALMTAHELTAEEADLVRRLDWRELIHYGVTFFVLEKLAAVVGVSNLHVYAAMRGQSLQEVQATPNPQIEYGVCAGRHPPSPPPPLPLYLQTPTAKNRTHPTTRPP